LSTNPVKFNHQKLTNFVEKGQWIPLVFPNPIISLSNIFLKRDNLLKMKINKLEEKTKKRKTEKFQKVEDDSTHSLKVSVGDPNWKKLD
jgi:hypothetical protein